MLRVVREYMLLSFVVFGAFACDGSTEPVVRLPAAVSVVAGANQSAAVGTAVPVNPAVRVVDDGGTAVSGVPVVFRVTGGGGTIAASTATTNADGIATAGSWTMGTTAGPQTLEATVATLAPVTVTATATAGAAAAVAVHNGDGQTAPAGTAVPELPAVRVTDAHGNPVADVSVTFAVASGGGSITGADAETDENGVAVVGSWTLGSAGPQLLTATVAGLPPVSLNAVATDPCAGTTALPLGAAVTGSLTASDCQDESGSRLDRFSLTVGAQTAVRIDVTPAAELRIYQALFTQDDQLVTARSGTAAGASQQSHFVLPAGTYTLEVGGSGASDIGDYAVVTAAAAPETCGLSVGIRPGVSITGAITATDCLSTFGNGLRYDQYALWLEAGTRVEGALTAGSPATLEVYHANTLVAAQASSTGNGNVVITAAATGYHYFSVVFTDVGATGAYRLDVDAGGDGCAATPALALNGWISGMFTDDSCRNSSGFATHTTTLELASQSMVRFGIGPNGAPGATPVRWRADLYRGDEFLVAWSTDDGNVAESFRTLLPAGSYTVRMRPLTAGENGGFHISATAESEDVGCEPTITATGITTNQQITASDCLSPITQQNRYDDYTISLVAGREYTFSATTPGSFLRLELWRNGVVVASASSDSGTPVVTFAPEQSGYYSLSVIAGQPLLTTSYSLSIR